MNTWKLGPIEDWQKEIIIQGPVRIALDYDDVDHEEVEIVAKAMVVTLNLHFNAIAEAMGYSAYLEERDNPENWDEDEEDEDG